VRSGIPWRNARELLKDVDKLPKGLGWRCQPIKVPGNTPDGISEEVEIYYRDVIELVKELIGNPAFNNPVIMAYEPVEVYVGPDNDPDDKLTREYGEAYTGKWWNEVQVCTVVLI
jgi:hypothetical protein